MRISARAAIVDAFLRAASSSAVRSGWPTTDGTHRIALAVADADADGALAAQHRAGVGILREDVIGRHLRDRRAAADRSRTSSPTCASSAVASADRLAADVRHLDFARARRDAHAPSERTRRRSTTSAPTSTSSRPGRPDARAESACTGVAGSDAERGVASSGSPWCVSRGIASKKCTTPLGAGPTRRRRRRRARPGTAACADTRGSSTQLRRRRHGGRRASAGSSREVAVRREKAGDDRLVLLGLARAGRVDEPAAGPHDVGRAREHRALGGGERGEIGRPCASTSGRDRGAACRGRSTARRGARDRTPARTASARVASSVQRRGARTPARPSVAAEQLHARVARRSAATSEAAPAHVAAIDDASCRRARRKRRARARPASAPTACATICDASSWTAQRAAQLRRHGPSAPGGTWTAPATHARRAGIDARRAPAPRAVARREPADGRSVTSGDALLNWHQRLGRVEPVAVEPALDEPRGVRQRDRQVGELRDAAAPPSSGRLRQGAACGRPRASRAKHGVDEPRRARRGRARARSSTDS